MLTRMRNALAVKKRETDVPFSTVKFHLAKILEKEGYLEGVEKITLAKRPMLRLMLAYDRDSHPRLRQVKRVSKPGRRVYAKSTELPRVMSDLGIAIISTPNGLMTNKEARTRHLGGEVICEVS